MGFLLLVSMAGKTSWLEQVLESLNADDKNLLSEYLYRLSKSLEVAQRTFDAKFCVLLSREYGITRKF